MDPINEGLRDFNHNVVLVERLRLSARLCQHGLREEAKTAVNNIHTHKKPSTKCTA